MRRHIEVDVRLVDDSGKSSELCQLRLDNIRGISDYCTYVAFVPDRGAAEFKHRRSDNLFVFLRRAFAALVRRGVLPIRRVPVSEISDGLVSWTQVEKYHTSEQMSAFRSFMIGQTVTFLPDGHTTGIFRDDYERWLRQSMPDKQGLGWD